MEDKFRAKLIDSKYNIKPGTRIRYPYKEGFCKHCARYRKDDYCSGLDNACDKVLFCMVYFYKRPK